MTETEATTKSEFSAPNAWLVHVDESGEDDVRTGIGTTRREDMSFENEDELEESERSTTLRNPQYRVSTTSELTVSVSEDNSSNEGLELLGVIDEDSQITESNAARSIEPDNDEYLEVAFFHDDVDFDDDGFDYWEDMSKVRRYADLIVTSPELDESEVPPVWEMTIVINGGVWTDYSQVVENGGGD